MANIHIHSGRYTNTSDIIYTFDGKHLYRGRYTYTSDILLTIDGIVPIIVLMQFCKASGVLLPRVIGRN